VPSMPVSRPETALLLQCARVGRSPGTTDRINSLIREGMDWEYLLQTAYKHGMGPLLYWHLNATCPEAVPTTAFTHLQNYFRANSQWNLFLTGEQLRLLRAFRAHGISIVPFKGPALAASVYGNLAFRQFGDLDILVERRHASKAKEVLVSRGYQPKRRPTRTQEAAELRSRRQQVFIRHEGTNKVRVELHWGIVEERYAFSLDPERLRERLDRIPLGGTMVPILSPEDTLLILCVHGYRHLWEQLGWICDVAELIRTHQDMGWEQVMAQARALGGERVVLVGLFLAHDLLEAPLPKSVQQKIWADPAVRAIGERICERLFRNADSPPDLYSYVLHLRMRERWVDRIRFCAGVALTQTVGDWQMLKLPDSLSPFYYVLRPIRLTRKLIRRSRLRISKLFL
jgi:Uncharacterised nucleotidyltransferase